MRGARRVLIALGSVVAGATVMVLGSGRIDSEPPRMTLEGVPETPVFGSFTVKLDIVDDAPGIGGWAATLAGDAAPLVEDKGVLVVDVSGLSDGVHQFVFEAWDRAAVPNLTRQEIDVTVDNQPPEIRLARRSLTTAQGRAHALLLQTTEPVLTPTGVFREAEITFYPLDESGRLWRALAGVPIEARTGRKTLSVRVEDLAGHVTERDVPVAVMSGRFSRGGTIQLTDEQVIAGRNEVVKKQMREERETAYSWEQAEQLWSGPFLWPVDGGKISSSFGRYRTYSDGRRRHHRGTDIAASIGTDVFAAAEGEVRFAGKQSIYGNVVIINHGHGLSTSYNHLSTIHVSVGERVEQGAVVGEVGTTGHSTGPHLGWGAVVGGTEVDGMRLMEDDLGVSSTPHWTHVTADGQLIPLQP